MEAWVQIGNQGTFLWGLTRKDFLKLLGLYPNFLPTQIQDLDKTRFQGITLLVENQTQSEDQREDEDAGESDDEDEGENEGENMRREIIIDLSHWILVPKWPVDKFVANAVMETSEVACLVENLDSVAITTTVDEAFEHFDENERASAVSKLQELLKGSQGPNHTKFEFGILILSAKYPNDVPFCSPELRDCIKDYATDAVACRYDWGTESYAKDYALFKSRYDLVMQKIHALGHKPAAQEVEKVAYVLGCWRALRGTFIDDLVTRKDELKTVSKAGANGTIIRSLTNSDYARLPKTIAVKSISEFNSHAVNYLSEIRVHATGDIDRVMSAKFCYQSITKSDSLRTSEPSCGILRMVFLG
ncbi:unnamed protein product [Colletotrichum noveboracense]|uniref:Uncharacterized protein n=1 Tax=Colletotrichum noveboracense TaxID=2664923 RepID=A0A9W4WBU6_9PEZI|nr:unnamed protein product [Colletotrichum noveboracense]